MADVNWKSIGGISIIGSLIGYIGAKVIGERRYRKHLVNKFGVFDAESSLPQAYLMENWEKKNPYEIHIAGCNHGNLAGGDSGHRVFGEASSSIKNVCNEYIGLWQDNFQGVIEGKPSDAEVDAINDMTFTQFMRNKYVKDTVPVKLSPCCKKDVRIKEYCDNSLIKDIQIVTPFNAESFSAEDDEDDDYCDDCGSTGYVCAVTDLCDDCMDSAGYDWDGRNRPNECPHCGEMDSMYINESRWECYECKKLAYDAESFSAESQFGDPEWKTKVTANNGGKPYLSGALSWDISYYTPLGITFDGDISKDPQRKHEGYTVLINCGNLGGCGGSKRMSISPKLLNLTKFKTMPQVKKAFKKFIDDLFTGKMKCQEGGETLTGETIAHCSGCDIWDSNDMTRNGYVCHHHLYTSDKIPPLIVYDDGRTHKTYACKKHTKEAIWTEENPNDNEYEVGGLTIIDSDLIPKEKYLNPRERRLRQRFGLGAETFEAESKKTNEMDKFFEWILKEKPTSKQTTKQYSRKVDYLAQRYSDAELKAGLINAYEAGDIDNAKLFAAAIGRQGFVSKYQAERKVY